MKPTILIFDQGFGAVRNVHTDLESYLSDEFNIVFHDWHFTNSEFYEKEKTADLVMTGLDGYYYLKNVFPFEHFKKYVFVSHGYPEFTDPLPDGLTYGMTSYVIRHFFPQNCPVYLVKNGVNHNIFNHVERTGELRTIGWCGRSTFPSKRFSMAAEIAISTNTPLSDASEKGWKSRDDLKEWYKTIDILLVTSGPEDWCETGPLPAFEAIASGVPVIGTKVGNFSCIPGPKFSTVEEGIQILTDLKSNPAKLREIAKEQYDCLLDLWTYEKNASQWKNLFNIGLEKARSSFQN
jgi:glycosyltransferase involved in cell wall biosynthesis